MENCIMKMQLEIGKSKLRLIEIFLKRLIKFKIVNKKMLSKYKRISTKVF